MSVIISEFEAAKKELLDFSNRNRLTNYRRPTQRRGGIEVGDELPDQIFQLLVEEQKVFTFLETTQNPAGSPTRLMLNLSDEEEQEDEPSDGFQALPDRYTDTKLQTSLSREELNRRLRRMYSKARTILEEQGINTLYLALGMLTWYESENSQEERNAPLILIPVELYRDNIRTRYKLRYTGEDIGFNISLQERLTREFAVQLPMATAEESLNIPAYFDALESALNRARWTLDRKAIVLDFFSFNKLQMYKDLDENAWNSGQDILEHPTLSKLFDETPGPTENPVPSDQWAVTSEPHKPQPTAVLVMDADSSQTKAILSALSGKNLVIQGPPGTGKSQTITNMIASAIAEGKRVLFVAEKMAALEVVKRRLDALELGDACLELHSHKSNKRSFLRELERTLNLGQPALTDQKHNRLLLQEARDYLEEYCRAVSTDIGGTGVTPYRAYGLYLRADQALENISSPPLKIEGIDVWDEEDYLVRLEGVARYQNLVARIGSPQAHPFWGSQRRSYLPADQRALAAQCVQAETAVHTLREAGEQAARLFPVVSEKTPQTTGACNRLQHLLQFVVESPDLSGVDIRNPAWCHKRAAIRTEIDEAEEYEKKRSVFEAYLLPEAIDEDFLPVRKALAPYSGRFSRFFRFFSLAYHRAIKTLQGLQHQDLPKNPEAQLQIVDALVEARRLRVNLQGSERLLQTLYGSRGQSTPIRYEELREIWHWFDALYSSEMPAEDRDHLFNYLQAGPDEDAKQVYDIVQGALADHHQSIKAVVELVDLDEDLRFGKDRSLQQIPFVEQADILHDWASRAHALQDMVTLNGLTAELKENGFAAVLPVAQAWEHASSSLVPLVHRTRYAALVERAMRAEQALAQFNGADHEARIKRFQELDRELLRCNRTIVLHKHWSAILRRQAGGLALLHEQFRRKRGHKSIRTLMAEAGPAIQSIKPVFMMSPFSIAAYLPPASVHFDLVIFDEASQVKPVDAFGAILRGQQTVVVGDDKQLPPTSFFDREFADESEDDHLVADMESILGLFLAKSVKEEMLQWHYRSRHESLIAVSNYEFYDNRLVVFPSPDKDSRHLGLVFHHLADTTYSRGAGGGQNDEEARLVAEAVIQHAREYPEKSLLVATFNIRQRDRIDSYVEHLRQKDITTEGFFAAHESEPFAIKNLENVQGDERDVIFISIGYGRDQNGRVAMNFGALNRQGGERRLNVLITRARQRCEVFTNLTAKDIDLSRTQARGVRALKRFLQYAETGRLDVPEETGGGPESPFEEAVIAELQAAGHQVHTQVGTGGYRIDIAVVDEKHPGRYLLGIECDGATYHSSQTARDRDRLRQEVLENMGWEIHRIWSTDWFRAPAREMQRLEESIERARAKILVVSNQWPGASENPTPQATAVKRTEVKQEDALKFPLYEMAQPRLQLDSSNLQKISTNELAAELIRIIEIEAPIHTKLLLQIVSKRVTKRVQAKVEQALAELRTEGRTHEHDDFLFTHKAMDTPVRDRRNVTGPWRKLELIHPQELHRAILTIAEHVPGLKRTELVRETLQIIGYARVTGKMKTHLDALVDNLLEQNRLTVRCDRLFFVGQDLLD